MPVIVRRYRREDVILVRLSDWRRLNATESVMELPPIDWPEIGETPPVPVEHPDDPA